ncbi:MAG: permease [Candidatus Peribacteraceae bacterium]|nr:permease [Candidatus Peribacteraceae bacterium]
MKLELKKLALVIGAFLAFYFMPVTSQIFQNAVLSGVALLNEYAREHILTCLVPAFFIAGAITVFIQKEVVLRYLGSKSRKLVSYSLASVSGSMLAVCSCTILPLFAGIRKRGAGLGPAITFLFSGPAINVAAIFLTLSVLGAPIGIARIVSAVVLSVLVGLSMQAIFREKPDENGFVVASGKELAISRGTLLLFFAALVGTLLVNGLRIDAGMKYALMIALGVIAAAIAFTRFPRETAKDWIRETWSFSKILLPLLFIGVFVAGFIMPLIPDAWITRIVGQNSLSGNMVASVFGAFMYFSTLTEIPILQALIAKGMSQGPALALLLAGPSLSLPNMLVVRRVLGNVKTAVYVLLVIAYSTAGGLLFGYILPLIA